MTLRPVVLRPAVPVPGPGRRFRPGPESAPEPLLRQVLGAILRDVRTGQERTLREVAERSGVSMPYLSEVERGRKEPSSEILAAVAGALGLRLVDLLAMAWQELAARVPVASVTGAFPGSGEYPVTADGSGPANGSGVTDGPDVVDGPGVVVLPGTADGPGAVALPGAGAGAGAVPGPEAVCGPAELRTCTSGRDCRDDGVRTDDRVRRPVTLLAA